VGLLRVHFPKASPEQLWNLSRLIIGSVYLLYFQLAGGASDGGKQVTQTEWDVLLKTGLISEDEKKRLSEFRGFKPFLMQVWAMRSVADKITEEKASGGAPVAIGPFQAQALTVRANCADIVNMMTQPIPFPYYHTLTLMLSLNLLLIAYSMIEFETVMTIPCFFIIVLVCLGLKETAVSLSDPFGGDAVDFETEVSMHATVPSLFVVACEIDAPTSPHFPPTCAQVYMANMLANAKAMISPSADYEPQTLQVAKTRK
jgi:hypothetical protein